MKTLQLILRSELKDYSKEDFYDSLCYLADNTSKINEKRKVITSEGGKDYEVHSKLIKIEGENDLYYYATTHTVYIVFNEFAGTQGYGYMSPYYSKNGKLCVYDIENKVITEIGE